MSENNFKLRIQISKCISSYLEGYQKKKKHFKIKYLDVIPTQSNQSLFDTQKNIFNVDQRNIRKIF